MRLLSKILPIWSTIMLVSTLFVSSCSRNSNDTTNSQAVAQTNQVMETADAATPAPAVPGAEANQPDMAALDRAARLWMFSNRRRPTSWDDFAAHAGIQIPPPPPGKKYVLSKDMRVSLVDL